MEYRKMGKWGVRLSSLGLGSYLTIGFKCDEETSREMVKVAYDNGGATGDSLVPETSRGNECDSGNKNCPAA